MLQKITLRAGVSTMSTRTLNEGGVSDANLVRWRMGLPQKFGGWLTFITGTLIGKCRALLAFTQLAGDRMLGAGTESRLYLVRGGTAFDVTPVDHTNVVNAAQIVATGTTIVTITTTLAHALSAGDIVTFDTITGTARVASALTVGGQPLAGDFVVASIVSTTAFTIALPLAASAATAGPGTLTVFLPAGRGDTTLGLGWGAGGWGAFGWGSPATIAANTLPLRIWSLAAWGQAMLALPTQERLYSWVPDALGNVTTRAVLVTNATPANGPPLRSNIMLIAQPERHAMLFGTSDLNSANNFDPMLVRWSDVEDFTSWRATGTNSAGSFRLQGGTEIRGASNSNLQGIIWTDSTLHTYRFIGLPFVYSFNKVGTNCGLIAQNAHAEVNGTVYWMSGKNFWRWQGGSPEIVPCTMLGEVFGRLTLAQRAKVTAGSNSGFGEVIWFYPADGSLECNRYVAFNANENCWYGGAMPRTVWVDNEIFETPVACDPDGQLWQQEQGYDANGAALGDYLQTGFWDIGDGQAISFCAGIIPDFQCADGGPMEGTLNLIVQVQDEPNGPIRTRGPFAITAATRRVPFRVRGRQMAIRLESDTLGPTCEWRLGAVRADLHADGQR